MVLQEPKFKTYVSLSFIQTNAFRRHKNKFKTTETNVLANSNRSGSVNTRQSGGSHFRKNIEILFLNYKRHQNTLNLQQTFLKRKQGWTDPTCQHHSRLIFLHSIHFNKKTIN
jgi:hypothetical protein